MDPRFPIPRDERQNVQMDIKQIHLIQTQHSDRLMRLEKRQADDAALKSVWGQSPFPTVMGGTPQQGPTRLNAHDDLDEYDEQGQNLIGSLHLEADDEPIRRGAAASRANSVRFDESALQGANWGQNSRHSGDFGPIRPGSGFGHGMMERSLSHKSDGRHSSAGHSVHSLHSGRASSLGLDTNFVVGSGDEDSPIDVPEPPPGLFVLGPVPSIVRCWLTESFAHDTILYAAACTGSQKSTIEHSLVKELGMSNDVHRDIAGVHRLRLRVFLTEAFVSQGSNTRTNGNSSEAQIPSMTTSFEVIGVDQPEAPPDARKAIRIVLGSDTLRAHSADLLFSQNMMNLIGNHKEKLSVPFVRPEDESSFKFLATTNMMPGKTKLNATAAPFVSASSAGSPNKVLSVEAKEAQSPPQSQSQHVQEPMSPAPSQLSRPETSVSNPSENDGDVYRQLSRQVSSGKKEASTVNGHVNGNGNGHSITPGSATSPTTENERRDSTSSSKWGSWRQPGASNGGDSFPPSSQRSVRSMKVLKSSKTTGSARTGASYEPPLPSRSSGESRRKSGTIVPPSTTVENGTPTPPTPVMRWDSKEQKRVSHGGESVSAPSKGLETAASKPSTKGAEAVGTPRELRTSISRSNPVGGASAFKWMSSPGAGSKASTPMTE